MSRYEPYPENDPNTRHHVSEEPWAHPKRIIKNHNVTSKLKQARRNYKKAVVGPRQEWIQGITNDPWDGYFPPVKSMEKGEDAILTIRGRAAQLPVGSSYFLPPSTKPVVQESRQSGGRLWEPIDGMAGSGCGCSTTRLRKSKRFDVKSQRGGSMFRFGPGEAIKQSVKDLANDLLRVGTSKVSSMLNTAVDHPIDTIKRGLLAIHKLQN